MITMFVISSFSVNAQPKSKPEDPYTILERGQHMTKVNIIKNLRGKGNSVQIDANNLSGGTTRLVTKGIAGEDTQIGHTEDMPGADITEIQPLLGNYGVVREVSKFGRGESILLTEAVFPLKLRITISNQILEVLIKEEGKGRFQ